MMLASNMIFFLYWGIKVYSEIKSTLIKNYRRFYIILCLCGKNQKYDNILNQTIVKEDNDILRENFHETLKTLIKICDDGLI